MLTEGQPEIIDTEDNQIEETTVLIQEELNESVSITELKRELLEAEQEKYKVFNPPSKDSIMSSAEVEVQTGEEDSKTLVRDMS